MADSTRICQLKVLWSDVVAKQGTDGRWSKPVLDVLLDHLASRDDIIVVNQGLCEFWGGCS